MAVLDIILLLLFIPGIIRGISKGFIEQLVDIAALIAGAWAAFKFSSGISEWLRTNIAIDGAVLDIISFIAAAIIAILVLHLLGRLIVKALQSLSLNWINKLLGLVFGIFKTALILGLLISAFEGINSKTKLISQEKLDDSVVYSELKVFSDKVFPFLEDLITPESEENGSLTSNI